VAGLSPQWVTIEDVPQEAIDAKRAEFADDPRTRDDVDGNVKRWLKEAVLYEQPFRDTNMAVQDLIRDRVATIGENILVRRFTRFALGEEL
jgi:elongation factor Ts